MKQKVYLLLKNLDQLKNKKYQFFAFEFAILGWYLFQLVFLLKPDSNCLHTFTLPGVDKVTTET